MSTDVKCEHSWTLTPQSKSYWPIPATQPGIISYHLVCLKCGAMERCTIGDFRQTVFTPCLACVNHPFCSIGFCYHQSNSLSELYDWIDSKRLTNKES